jgi:hypothetical protein
MKQAGVAAHRLPQYRLSPDGARNFRDRCYRHERHYLLFRGAF